MKTTEFAHKTQWFLNTMPIEKLSKSPKYRLGQLSFHRNTIWSINKESASNFYTDKKTAIRE